MRRRMISAFWPCMLLVTLMRCVTRPPGATSVPLAGANLSAMNFGTAACAPKRALFEAHRLPEGDAVERYHRAHTWSEGARVPYCNLQCGRSCHVIQMRANA